MRTTRCLALAVFVVMTVGSATATASATAELEPAAALRITGTFDGAGDHGDHLPPVFRLRAENGCPRDVTLATTARTTRGFSLALSARELADVFACAIDIDAGEETLPTIIPGSAPGPITVTPDAEVWAPEASEPERNGLWLDRSFAVVAASLDPRDGHLVRFTVGTNANANEAIDDAQITLDGAVYRARIAPAEEGSDTPNSAVFDVPARAWASAVIARELALVDVKLDGGAHRALTLRATARIDTISADED